MSAIYVDVDHVPLVKQLVAKFGIIRDECLKLFQLEGDVDKVNALMEGQHGRNLVSIGQPKYAGKNASLHLRVVRDLLDPAEANAILCPSSALLRAQRRARCPELMSILSPYEDMIGNIGFNRLFPGARITPHYGVITAKNYVRVHLGIQSAVGATFFVKNGPEYTWRDGEIMAFNDGTVLHWVEHTGTTPRTILSIDIKRELL